MTGVEEAVGRAAGAGPLLLGVRHHGPGSARAVRAALEEARPRVVLIEGPPEADALIPLAADEVCGRRSPCSPMPWTSPAVRRSGRWPSSPRSGSPSAGPWNTTFRPASSTCRPRTRWPGGRRRTRPEWRGIPSGRRDGGQRGRLRSRPRPRRPADRSARGARRDRRLRRPGAVVGGRRGAPGRGEGGRARAVHRARGGDGGAAGDLRQRGTRPGPGARGVHAAPGAGRPAGVRGRRGRGVRGVACARPAAQDHRRPPTRRC
ncbi:hypothetical protein SVIOM74S_06579 [Streptomyces violarus]